MWVVLLQGKDEVLGAIKKVQAAAEVEKAMKLEALHIDRGGELTSEELIEYCERLGIKHFQTTPG